MIVLEGLRTFRPSTTFSPERTRAVDRDGEADLSRTSLQALDELKLLSGKSCVAGWGLVEPAARLRSSWS
jgi:hypothetical protein